MPAGSVALHSAHLLLCMTRGKERQPPASPPEGGKGSYLSPWLRHQGQGHFSPCLRKTSSQHESAKWTPAPSQGARLLGT